MDGLTLGRNHGETVIITNSDTGEEITITVLTEFLNGKPEVKINFKADPKYKILRGELLDRKN
jgi:sRNA-binding carbon storage regulator CsrA